MQSCPKEIDIYVHRLIHESLIKQVNNEYHFKYYLSNNDTLKIKNPLGICNYRGLGVHRKTNFYDWFIYKFNHEMIIYVKIPERYFFSSGMNSLEGYKND